MSSRAQQEEYLSIIARSYMAGEFDYLSHQQLKALDQLIADAWAAFKLGGDVQARIRDVQQMLESNPIQTR